MTEVVAGSKNDSWFWQTDIGQHNTCTSATVSWQWISTDDTVTVELSLTQIGVPQDAPPASSSVASGTLTTSSSGSSPTLARRQASSTSTASSSFQTSLVRSIRASAETYTIDKLNVPEGWYEIIAASPDSAVRQWTTPFYIWTGQDTSCIPSTTPTSASSSDQASSTSGSGPTASSTSTQVPSGSLGSGSNHTGAIAGGVVGGLAFLAFLVALLFFYRRRRQNAARRMAELHGSASASSAAGPGHRKPGKWGGLSSVDSIDAAAAMAMARSGATPAGAVAMDDIEKSSPTTSPFETEYTFTPDALGYQLSGPPSRRPSATGRYSATSDLSGGVPMSTEGAISVSPPSPNGFDRYAATPSPSPGQPTATTVAPGKPRRKPVPSYTPSTVSGINDAPNIGVIPSLPPLQVSSSTSGSSNGHQQWAKDGKVHYLMPDMPSQNL